MAASKPTDTALAGKAPALLLCAIAALVVSALLWTSPVSATTESFDVKNDASAFITHLGRRVISLLSEPEKMGQKEIIAFRKIFTDALDMQLIARQVMGRHWRVATQEQRQKYLMLFAEYVVQIYASQFSNYSGESFDVYKEQGAADEDRVVKTRIIADNGEITHVDFRVHKDGPRFRVVDVAVRGVSLLVAKRSEFDVIIRHKGVNGLLAQLKAKVEKENDDSDPVSRLAKETFKALENLVTFGDSKPKKPKRR